MGIDGIEHLTGDQRQPEQTIEEYIKKMLEKRYLEYVEANSCPKCKVPLGMLDDKKSTFCVLCGYRSVFKIPD